MALILISLLLFFNPGTWIHNFFPPNIAYPQHRASLLTYSTHSSKNSLSHPKSYPIIPSISLSPSMSKAIGIVEKRENARMWYAQSSFTLCASIRVRVRRMWVFSGKNRGLDSKQGIGELTHSFRSTLHCFDAWEWNCKYDCECVSECEFKNWLFDDWEWSRVCVSTILFRMISE